MSKRKWDKTDKKTDKSLDELMFMAGAAGAVPPQPIPAMPPESSKPAEQAVGDVAGDVAPASLGILPDGASVRATDRLGIRIQKGLKERFQKVAEARGLTMSEMAVELIRRAVDAGETNTK